MQVTVFKRCAVGLAVLAAAGFTAISQADPVREAGRHGSLVFVCPNGVSMSVWSAAYFNRLAATQGLRQRAIARAALPTYTEVPFRMRIALAADGFRLNGYRPRVIDEGDTRNAELIILIEDGTRLPSRVHVDDAIRAEQWTGFPPMRDRYFVSRAALKERVEALAARLATIPPS